MALVKHTDQIRTFITINFYVPEDSRHSNDDSRLDQGIIDSTGLLKVIESLEEEFGITVEDDEILPENLDSIARISTFVECKKSQ